MTTIGVHGFTYDPGSKASSAELDKLEAEWALMLGTPVELFRWYSSPIGFKGWCRAVTHGFWNQYAYAYQQLASSAAELLAARIVSHPASVIDILDHSLGSRVALRALLHPEVAAKVRNILILDGAEIPSQIILPSSTALRVFNVTNAKDHVLRDLGSRFSGIEEAQCIGFAGNASAPRPVWRDIFLSDKKTADKIFEVKGWVLESDALFDLEDHCTSYRWKGNWPLYRAIMSGDQAVLSAIEEIDNDRISHLATRL